MHKFKDKYEHEIDHLEESFQGAHLHDAKAQATNLKHRVGKIFNIVNPNHRHDEAHEQATDNKRSEITESHRFKSFAPICEGNRVKWYVDARDYLWAVSEALEKATETIYIADWWLSPELFLRRPPFQHREWRLDQILKRRAEAGVKIYVIVYKEVHQALTCNSAHTKHALQSLCPQGTPGHGNIRVLRHPDHNVFENAADMTLYWAHHEKLIVIDYALAFIGGIDLCFGRWDANQHPLADVHPSGLRDHIFPGQDFNNNRIMDFQSVDDWQSNELSKAEYGRMPWHDVAMGLIGDCVYDIAEHFVLRWNFVKRDKYKRTCDVDWLLMEGRMDENEDIIAVQRPKYPCGEYIQHPLTPLSNKPRGQQGSVRAQIVRSSDDWSSGILNEHSIQNAYCETIRNAQHFVYIENQFFITATGDQQRPIFNTLGRAIVDACVRAGKEGRRFRVIIVISAIPGFAGDLRDSAAAGTRAIMDYQYKSICRGDHSIMGQIKKAGVDPTQQIFVFALRAYDRINRTPALEELEKMAGVNYQDIQRGIAESIMSESVHPAIGKEGDENEKSYEADSAQKQENLRKFKKFEEQVKQLKADEGKASRDSVAHTNMLNGNKMSDEVWEGDAEAEKANIVQEELYVHGKMCIVDDRTVICGSANINDRSQLGSHDSELAIVMEDQDFIDSQMNGQPYLAARLAATLRRQLWREHLGLLPAQNYDASNAPNSRAPDVCLNEILEGAENDFVTDPLSDAVWKTWTEQASVNTETYRMLFRADPDNNIKAFEDYDNFRPRRSKQGHLFDPYQSAADVRQMLDRIKGHLVWLPLDFLCNAEMTEPGLAVNQITKSIYT
ncbi:uncharacterized protein N7477_010257 [Penicillium maclennaniae]|uniref:uncharacterized protein n=1 Tax=Penicillium maclennaniae TaxID=1343394 RepID=UPI002540F9F6|nr:uncharacterized protein N7477_010257 [Penicillium maclennaniae]KAJ5662641.1 hypothetical protein N7477_010257 [Penicillium maclennaniae]